MKKILITGISGMIGFHLSKELHRKGFEILGFDNFNDYYDVNLKLSRSHILKNLGINIIKEDLLTIDYVDVLKGVDVVIHLAAYANPRHSLDNPQVYIDTNITGTQRLIDAVNDKNIPVIYASSSCVMHGQTLPWNETDKPDHQNNPYGWSKRINECQFKHSKVVRSIGLRFFTVYGEYGRPDMALFLFTKAILEDKELIVYNNGEMFRDFTYVSDIVKGISIVLNKIISDKDEYHDIFNIGYGEKVNLLDFIKEIEINLKKKGKYNFKPHHPADVPATWSDTTKLKKLGYSPKVDVKEGIKRFIDWYITFYNINN